ncbi:MAG: aldo/keto reductase [Deltaproteobacteria bacterium]|nr:aldo/keto reductase [Candidatus Zymogenaceae bacterium]
MNFTERRTLGRTGLQVSRLGLAGGYGISGKGVEKAYKEYGINYFYWSTPRRSGMGEGLRTLAKKHRDDIIIVLQSYDHFGLMTGRSVEKGLMNLGVDFADVLLLGWHNRYPMERLVDSALREKDAGRVRFIAMSGHNRKLFGRIARMSDSPIDIFMTRYNAAHRGAEEEIFPYLPKSNRPGVTIYTATRHGSLLKPKKMPPGDAPMSAADCYRFVLSHPDVDLCMTGPGSMAQLDEGARALKLGPLSDDEMARIRRIGDYVHG